jgi:cytochrome b involved in lipid metabolism
MFAAWAAFLGAIAALTWVAVSSERPDPADPAREATYTLEEVAAHDSASDCWMAIDGGVYDLTDYLPDHPTRIRRHCGTEASEGMHTKGIGRPHSAFAWEQLSRYRIGGLEESGASEESGRP